MLGGGRRSGHRKRHGILAHVIIVLLDGSQEKWEKRMSRKGVTVPFLTATEKPGMNPRDKPLSVAIRNHGRLLRKQ